MSMAGRRTSGGTVRAAAPAFFAVVVVFLKNKRCADHPENESFTPNGKTTVLEGAKGGWWGAQNANDRMLMIGWALGDFNGAAGPGITFLTRLTLLREVNFDAKTNDLVSNPVPELVNLRSGLVTSEKVALTANTVHHVAKTSGGAAASADIVVNFTVPQAGAQLGACVLAAAPGGKAFVPHWETLPNTNAAYDRVGVPGNKSTFLGNASDANACLALCKAESGCQEWAWKIFGPKPPPAFLNSTDACYMINDPTDLDTPGLVVPGCRPGCPQAGATSGKFWRSDSSTAGIGITIAVGADKKMQMAVGACAPPKPGAAPAADIDGGAKTVALLDDEDVVSVRILPDRSVVDFFVQGGRWSGTQSWISGAPRAADASQVSVWSGSAGVTADVEVHGMGCGWESPSYTDSPTM